MRVAAFDETVDDLLLDRAPNSAGLAQFRRMAPYALPKRARTRVARAIEPGAWRARRPAPRRSSAAYHPGRISVVLGTQTTTFARGTLNVGGSLKDPLLSP